MSDSPSIPRLNRVPPRPLSNRRADGRSGRNCDTPGRSITYGEMVDLILNRVGFIDTVGVLLDQKPTNEFFGRLASVCGDHSLHVAGEQARRAGFHWWLYVQQPTRTAVDLLLELAGNRRCIFS